MDAELHIKGYSLYRQDRVLRRSNRGRGSWGVVIYVRDDAAINTEVIFNFSNRVVEALGIHIKDWNLVVFITYRSPDNNRQKSAFNEFSQLIKSMNQCLRHLPAPTPDVILGGDLNLPNADWDSGECLGSNRIREELKIVQALHELATEHVLIQPIEYVLDVLFTNNSNLVHSYTCTYSGQSDHNIVEVKSFYKTTASHNEQHPPEVTKEDIASIFSLNFFNEDIDWERINSAFKE